MKRMVVLAQMRKPVLLLAIVATAALVASGIALVAVAEPAGAEVLPRNGKILFHGDSSSDFSNPFELQTMNPDGSNRSSFAPPIHGVAPEWSPDGTKVAFTSDEDTSIRPIVIMSADGTEQTIVPNTDSLQGAGGPTWSPDSAKLAFQTLVFGD